MRIFFYGLFMDENLLASKGIRPLGVNPGFVNDFDLRIGERATLLCRPGGRAYGVVMELDQVDVKALYADASVADYVPESVTVVLKDNTRVEATCYNLPRDQVTETNNDYARSLLAVAARFGFPESYLDQIRRASMQGKASAR